MLSDRCPVLSVTLVYCGQTVGWIKMKLGMQIGLSPFHNVLDEARQFSKFPLPQSDTAPNFRPISVMCPNGWMHHDATWYVLLHLWLYLHALCSRSALLVVYYTLLGFIVEAWTVDVSTLLSFCAQEAVEEINNNNWYGGRPRPRRLC